MDVALPTAIHSIKDSRKEVHGCSMRPIYPQEVTP
jgi:hypothetical protein